MNLTAYLSKQRGRAACLAKALFVRPVMVSQWASGRKKVSVHRAMQIERATAGAVRCEELRPDVDWAILRNSLQPQAKAFDAAEVRNHLKANSCLPVAHARPIVDTADPPVASAIVAA